MAGSLAAAITGINYSWSSSALPYLKSKDSKFLVTETQGGWIVSIYSIGDIIGALLNPFLIDRIGRKFSLLLSGVLAVIDWLLIIFAENHVHLLLARFISGVGQAFTLNTLVIYIAEIAEKDIRGTLASIVKVMQSISYFTFTAIGLFLPYEILNLSSFTVPIIFLLTFSFMPESPYYFLLCGKDEDAMKCLMKLRGIYTPETLIPVIREMKLDLNEKDKIKKNALHELVSKSYNRKGLLIILCMKMTQLMTGIGAIANYKQEIFSHSGSKLSPKVSVLIIAGIGFISSFGSTLLVDRISKRVIFLISGTLIGILMGAVGLFFFLKLHVKTDVSSITWIPLAAFISLHIIYSLGLSIIPFILLGELFGMNVKGSAVGCSMIIGGFFAFTTTEGYNVVNNIAGIYTVFWIFAIFSIIGSSLTYWITPESNGKTLEEIQAMQNPEMNRKLELERKNRSETFYP